MVDSLLNLFASFLFFAGIAAALVWLITVASKSALKRIDEEKGGLHKCEKCGYDLRATPNVCPECGRRVLDRTPVDLNVAKMIIQWPASPRALRKVGLQESLQPVWYTTSLETAKTVARFLVACGIPPAIKLVPRSDGRKKVTIAQLEVWDEDLEPANNLLGQFTRIPDSPDLTP